MAALSPEEVSHLVDEMAADPDDKHMPASARYVPCDHLTNVDIALDRNQSNYNLDVSELPTVVRKSPQEN